MSPLVLSLLFVACSAPKTNKDYEPLLKGKFVPGLHLGDDAIDQTLAGAAVESLSFLDEAGIMTIKAATIRRNPIYRLQRSANPVYCHPPTFVDTDRSAAATYGGSVFKRQTDTTDPYCIEFACYDPAKDVHYYPEAERTTIVKTDDMYDWLQCHLQVTFHDDHFGFGRVKDISAKRGVIASAFANAQSGPGEISVEVKLNVADYRWQTSVGTFDEWYAAEMTDCLQYNSAKYNAMSGRVSQLLKLHKGGNAGATAELKKLKERSVTVLKMIGKQSSAVAASGSGEVAEVDPMKYHTFTLEFTDVCYTAAIGNNPKAHYEKELFHCASNAIAECRPMFTITTSNDRERECNEAVKGIGLSYISATADGTEADNIREVDKSKERTTNAYFTAYTPMKITATFSYRSQYNAVDATKWLEYFAKGTKRFRRAHGNGDITKRTRTKKIWKKCGKEKIYMNLVVT